MQYLGTIDKAKDIINKDFVEKLLGDYQPLINESSKLPYSLISGVPTSLPASDVYSWAKSATKPTYKWSEITSKPTWIGSSKPSYSYSEITGAISTTELQNYLTSNSYLDVTSGDNRYLKLSGGTLTGKTSISARLSLTNGAYLEFVDKNESIRLFGVYPNKNDLSYYDGAWNNVWHSGNDGSGSGLDADLLDGRQPSELKVGSADVLAKSFSENINYGTYHSALKLIYNTQNDNYGFPSLYVSGLSVMAGYTGWQLMSHGGPTENPYFRSLQDTGAWKPWRQIAFLTDNVASATKLENNDSYTAWGQTFFINGKPNSFNGTAYFPNGDLIYAKDEGGTSRYVLGFTSSLGLGYGSAGAGYDTYVLGNNVYLRYSTSRITGFTLNSSGNVGIGTTNPSAKLEVNGITRLLSDLDVKGYLYTSGLVYLGANSDGIYLHATGINFHTSSNTWTASCVTFDGNGNMTALHNLLVNGGITMYSDQRKKTILNHVELSLKQIANAPLIEHYYNNDDAKTTHVGSIAQYWASMNDWFCKLDSEGFYTMEIQNAALASAISIARELDRYETKTDKAINKLKKRICELEEEVERLKAS